MRWAWCGPRWPLSSRSPATAEQIPVACADSGALVAAVNAANASPGASEIVLGAGCTYALGAPDNHWFGPNGLPPIASEITIRGNGATIQRSAAAAPFRLLFVGADPGAPETSGYVTLGAGRLTLRDLTLQGGLARGGNGRNPGGGGAGMGGAIFNMGDTTLDAVTATGNTAQGGTSIAPLSGTTGGGGGIGEDAPGAVGGGFGPGAFGGPGGGLVAAGGGGGGGFAGADTGGNAVSFSGGSGGGPATGLGGSGGAALFGGPFVAGGPGGNGAGGGGSGVVGGGTGGGAGGGFGAGGGAGSDGGGGGGVGGGGGFGGGFNSGSGSGGGGFGAGGGGGRGSGGFGGGGGIGGTGGFGGGAGNAGGTAFGGGGGGFGGAVFNLQGRIALVNSTLSGNSALGGAGQDGGAGPAGFSGPGLGSGGAVFNLNGRLSVAASTLTDNQVLDGADPAGGGTIAPGDGSALYELGYDAATLIGGSGRAADATATAGVLTDPGGGVSSLVSDRPATVAGGASNLASATVTLSEANIVTSRSQFGAGTITGTPSTSDPQLGGLADNGGPGMETQRPAPSSPALGAWPSCAFAPLGGGPAQALARDQRGALRPANACDLGAVEVVSPPAVQARPATSVAQTGATLNGSVTNHGVDASARFEYGTTTAYGSTTPSAPLQAQAGPQPRSQAIAGLTPEHHLSLPAGGAEQRRPPGSQRRHDLHDPSGR